MEPSGIHVIKYIYIIYKIYFLLFGERNHFLLSSWYLCVCPWFTTNDNYSNRWGLP